jgi:hypothetical protein
MSKMRAKMKVSGVKEYFSDPNNKTQKTQEALAFSGVCKKEGYKEDGLDEDNTFAKWTPHAEFSLSVTNPSLFGQFKIGELYYVDFTEATE